MVLVGMALIGSPTPAHAATGSPSFSLRPTTWDKSNPNSQWYFIMSGTAGTTFNSSLHIFNGGSAAGTAKLLPVDAGQQQYGGIGYLSNSTPTEVGAWVSPLPSQVTLNALQNQDIPFTLTIPANARSGQHVGGIVARNMSTTSTGMIKVVSEIVVPIVVNVSGVFTTSLVSTAPISHFVMNGYSAVQVPILNNGNMMVRPTFTMNVTDSHNNVVATTVRTILTILPSSAISYPATLPTLAAGTYTVDVVITYEGNHTLHITNQIKL